MRTDRKTFTYIPIELQCEKVLEHISTEKFQKEHKHEEFLKSLKQDIIMHNEFVRLENESILKKMKQLKEYNDKLNFRAQVVERDEEEEEPED